MNAAANGPSSPNSTSRTASADGDLARWSSRTPARSGRISTPAEPIAPAVASMVRKVVAGDDPAVVDVARSQKRRQPVRKHL